MVVIVGTDIAEYTDDNGIRYTFLLVLGYDFDGEFDGENRHYPTILLQK
jgi:hypothetical protein